MATRHTLTIEEERQGNHRGYRHTCSCGERGAWRSTSGRAQSDWRARPGELMYAWVLDADGELWLLEANGGYLAAGSRALDRVSNTRWTLAEVLALGDLKALGPEVHLADPGLRR